MEKLIGIFLIFLSISSNAASFNINGQCDVYFSPNGGAQDAIVKLIDSSKKNIFMLAYSFTSDPIAAALKRAKSRGVDVNVIIDEVQSKGKGSELNAMIDSKINVWIDGKHAIAHNKVIIVDNKIIETGSFNYSANAENRNGENVLICTTMNGAKLYKQDWDKHMSHSIKR